MGILAMDETGRITEFQEKPKQPKSDLASMGVYVFSKRALHRWLDRGRARTSAATSSRPCSTAAPGSSAIASTATGRTSARSTATGRPTWPSWRIGPLLDLYDKEWLIHTRSEERAPAKIGATAQVHRSLVSHGCQVDGMVVNSVLSPGVVVGVGRGGPRLDPHVRHRGPVRARSSTGRSSTRRSRSARARSSARAPTWAVANRLTPSHLNTGITIVGKRAVIPRGIRIGRNVRIDPDVRATDFAGPQSVESGATGDAPRRAGREPTRPPGGAGAAGTTGGRSRWRSPRDRRGGASRAATGDRRAAATRRGGRGLAGRARAWPASERIERDARRLLGPPASTAGAASTSGSRSSSTRRRGRRLGPPRAADRRLVPRLVPAAAALERRVPVRQVRPGRGRPARPDRRDPGGPPRPRRAGAGDRPGAGRSATCSSRRRPRWAWIGGRIPDWTAGSAARQLVARYAPARRARRATPSRPRASWRGPPHPASTDRSGRGCRPRESPPAVTHAAQAPSPVARDPLRRIGGRLLRPRHAGSSSARAWTRSSAMEVFSRGPGRPVRHRRGQEPAGPRPRGRRPGRGRSSRGSTTATSSRPRRSSSGSARATASSASTRRRSSG